MNREDRERKRGKEADVVSYLLEKSQEVAVADTLRKNRTTTTTAGRERLFIDQLRGVLKEAFRDKLPVPKLNTKAHGKTRRILNFILSDTHYGSALDQREVGHSYGAVEEARRTAAICKQVAEYKQQYRGETEVYMHVLGDMIQGQLHDMRDGLPLAEQVASAMRILIQAIRYLSVQFPKGVTVFCTPGNHGRNTARHRERATNQKWDSIETMIYVAMKEACTSLKNVKVVLGYEPKYEFDAFGKLGFGTHGDTVLNPGYPGKTIDVGGLKKQINDINNARVTKGMKPYHLFIVGHVHTGAMVHLPGKVTVVTNSCLLPPDPFAQSIGITDTACGQWLWESVDGHLVGDCRFMEVDESNDVDKSLDSIIQPFTGL